MLSEIIKWVWFLHGKRIPDSSMREMFILKGPFIATYCLTSVLPVGHRQIYVISAKKGSLRSFVMWCVAWSSISCSQGMTWEWVKEVLCEAREITSWVLGSYTFFPSFFHLSQQIVIELTVYEAWCQHKFKDKSSVSRWDIPFSFPAFYILCLFKGWVFY